MLVSAVSDPRIPHAGGGVPDVTLLKPLPPNSIPHAGGGVPSYSMLCMITSNWYSPRWWGCSS